MRHSRSVALALCAALMAGLITAGVSYAEQKYKGVTITVSACVEDVWDKVRKPKIAEFEAKTGIKVIVDDVAFGALREKHIAEMSAKTGAFDVLYIIEPFVAEYQGAGFLLPMDKVMSKEEIEQVKKEFFPSLLKVVTFNNRLYGVPGSVMMHSFVVRKDLLAQHGLGVPKTWEELLEAARRIHNPSKGIYGFALPAGRMGSAQEMFEEILVTTGARTFDEKWKPLYNSPEALKTLKFWIELYKVSPPEASNWWWVDIWNALLQGSAAMTYGSTVSQMTFNEPSQSKFAGNFEFIPMVVPQERLGKPYVGRVNTVNWVIPADSKNPQAAWEFIKWINSFEMKKAEALSGLKGGTFDSALRKYYEDPEILAARPHAKMQAEHLKSAETMPLIPEMPRIIDILTLRLNQAVLGQLSPQEALDKVNAEVESLMKEAGYYNKK